jgi:Fe-S-cluster containining protein
VKECDKCGACCRQLIVEVYDLDVMREQHLATADISGATRGDTYQALMADLEQEGHCLVIAGGGEACEFLRGDNTCAIYPTRPNACVGLQAGDEQCHMARKAEGIPPL